MQTTSKLPYHFALQHGICLGKQEESAILYYKKEISPETLMEIRRVTETPLTYQEVLQGELEQLLSATYANTADSTQKLAVDAGEALSLEMAANTASQSEDLLSQQDYAPIIRLINALLMEALREKASDIHFETFERKLTVRMRIDGVLQQAISLPPTLAPILTSRIKVMAKLDIAEKRLPQDGRISLRIGSQEVDVRVSTMPTGTSERIVLRLLNKQAGRLNITQLGLSEHALSAVQHMIQAPHGIILVTGPTGSGKTTSLYAMLSELNDSRRNILTIEDPIEYQIEGIGQTQVNTKVDFTFARGLRAILRQDPDVVMIGEIRDLETAKTAVQASLTGHLVFSTLHTNSAVGAITRLVDMGVEPFLLSSSMVGVIAQRLVRALCHECKREQPVSKEEETYLGANISTVFHPVGCPSCRRTGYKGRIGIYEIIPMDETIRTLIHNGASEQAIEQHAHRTGNTKLIIGNDGREKIMQGITSIEEVMRVTEEQ